MAFNIRLLQFDNRPIPMYNLSVMTPPNILLINPAINPASQNKIVNAMVTNILPTSLGSLVAFLNGAGIESIRIIDEQMDFIKDDELARVISSLERPRIIGISVLTISSKRAYELAEKIKAIDPGSTVVLGGIHPTVLPEEALRHSGVDAVVRGEGEETFLEIIRNIFQDKDYRKIPGMSFIMNGKVTHNPERPLITDLDNIPPFPYHMFEKDVKRYNSFAAVSSSRGCPYSCTFCSSRNISGKKYRYFSVGRIIYEIKLLVEKYGQKTVWFMDDNPAANPNRFIRLLDGIIENGLHKKAQFHCSMRGDNLNEEILKKCKTANFKIIYFGLETMSEPLMEIINKAETVKQVTDAIKKTHAAGLAAGATLIFGLPTETRKDRWDAIRAVRKLPLQTVRFNTLTPYPGTPVYEELKKQDKLLIKDNWENFGVQYMWEGNDIPYVPDGNSRYELIFDTMYANFSFYLSFSGIKRMVRSSLAAGNVIQLKKRWFLSPKTLWNISRLFFYLGRRFLWISAKVASERIFKPRHKLQNRAL